MIHEARISGFQSLDDIALELAPFTVIVGRSNSGKSAFRRAIQGLVANAPAAGRVATGSKELEVTLKTEVDGSVTWRKGPKVNTYVVDGLEITKPGSSCPQSAQDLLGLGPVNFASQFDPPFLLMDSASSVANTLGALTNVNVLFAGIRESEKLRRAANSRAKTLEEERAFNQALFDSAMGELPSEQARLTRMGDAITAAMGAESTAALTRKTLESAETHLSAILTAKPEADRSVPGPYEQISSLIEMVREMTASVVAAERLQSVLGLPIPTSPALMLPDASLVNDAMVMSAGLLEAEKQALAIQAFSDGIGALDETLRLTEVELATFESCPTCGTLLSKEPHG